MEIVSDHEKSETPPAKVGGLQCDVLCECGNALHLHSQSASIPGAKSHDWNSQEMILAKDFNAESEASRAKKLAPGTWRQYRAKLNQFEEWRQGREAAQSTPIPLQHLVEEWLEPQKSLHGAPTPALYNKSAMALVFRYGKLLQIKFQPLNPPKIRKVMSEAEVCEYLGKFSPNLELHALQWVQYETASRIGEVATQLRWKSVDLESGKI